MPEVNKHVHEHVLIDLYKTDYSDTAIYWCYKCGKVRRYTIALTQEGGMEFQREWEVGAVSPIKDDRKHISTYDDYIYKKK